MFIKRESKSKYSANTTKLNKILIFFTSKLAKKYLGFIYKAVVSSKYLCKPATTRKGVSQDQFLTVMLLVSFQSFPSLRVVA